MTDENIKKAIQCAIRSLLSEVPPLKLLQVHERSTGHRLALHLEPLFPGWNIDCEYDRSGEMQKIVSAIQACKHKAQTGRIFPDIIVHHRLSYGCTNNLVVIELKKSKRSDTCDFEKLKHLTKQDGLFAYQLGLYVNVSDGAVECTWFKDGSLEEP